MSDTAKDQLESLVELQQSKGWQLFMAMVQAEVAGTFEANITRALDTADAAVALDKMRQIAAVRLAGLRWIRWPGERLESLKQQLAVTEAAESPSRRPYGV